MPAWQVVCDFDGTIALDDVTDGLLARFADPIWAAIETDWREGRIDARTCLTRQVALIEADPFDLDRYLDEVPVDEAFPRFVSDLDRRGIALVVASDGLDRAVHRILDRLGLGRLPVLANRFAPAGNNRWRVGFPYAREHCRAGNGVCKCAAASAGASRRTLLIGDGRSDFCLASNAADLVFAKGALATFSRARELACVPITGFAEARRLLPLLAPWPAPLSTEASREERRVHA